MLEREDGLYLRGSYVVDVVCASMFVNCKKFDLQMFLVSHLPIKINNIGLLNILRSVGKNFRKNM